MSSFSYIAFNQLCKYVHFSGYTCAERLLIEVPQWSLMPYRLIASYMFICRVYVQQLRLAWGCISCDKPIKSVQMKISIFYPNFEKYFFSPEHFGLKSPMNFFENFSQPKKNNFLDLNIFGLKSHRNFFENFA